MWLLDSLDLCSLQVLAVDVDPQFKQLVLFKSEQITRIKAELEARMLLESEPDDGSREEHPDTDDCILRNTNKIKPWPLISY